MSDLPPFNPKAKCPKCGWREVVVLYQEYAAGPSAKYWPLWREFFLRTCERCQYEWIEATPEQLGDGILRILSIT